MCTQAMLRTTKASRTMTHVTEDARLSAIDASRQQSRGRVLTRTSSKHFQKRRCSDCLAPDECVWPDRRGPSIRRRAKATKSILPRRSATLTVHCPALGSTPTSLSLLKRRNGARSQCDSHNPVLSSHRDPTRHKSRCTNAGAFAAPLGMWALSATFPLCNLHRKAARIVEHGQRAVDLQEAVLVALH